MHDESPVCRVASRLIVAAWSGDPEGREIRGQAAAGLPIAGHRGTGRYDSICSTVSSELKARGLLGRDHCLRAFPARARGSLPFELVDLALDLQADLLWVWSRLDGWLRSSMSCVRSASWNRWPVSIRARSGVEPDDVLPPNLRGRDRAAAPALVVAAASIEVRVETGKPLHLSETGHVTRISDGRRGGTRDQPGEARGASRIATVS